MIRDLDDKELDQNKVLCSSSRIELPIVKLPLQTSRRSLHQGDRSPATRRLLALRTALTWIIPYRPFLVASSLSLHLACFLAHTISRPHFRFKGSIGLTVGLAIGGAVLMAGEVALGLS